MAISPMMQQYMDIKKEYGDCILFFRLGDFYEMFFDDALTASKELELTLTGKSYGQEERAPMCGVPFHSAETYIAKLVERGYKVAICEQTEDPALAKGIVKREVLQIVTPGTLTSAAMLDEKENNFIASAYVGDDITGLAYADVSTGQLFATEFGGDAETRVNSLINELVKTDASELLINSEAERFMDFLELQKTTGAYINKQGEAFFSEKAAEDALKRQFSLASLSGLGLSEKKEALRALGSLLSYLLLTQKRSLDYLGFPKLYEQSDSMALDKATIRNLELSETIFDKKSDGSLLWVLDKCRTAMGSRLLKAWLRQPLNRSALINRRLDALEILYDEYLSRNDLREALKQVYDLERLAARISYGNANARDLIALKTTLSALPGIAEELSALTEGKDPDSLLREILSDIRNFDEIEERINSAIFDEPPFSLKEGGLIKPGYSEELDGLKASIKDAREWIASLEQKEKERSGIKNLKVGFNRVFGYYIEVSRSNLSQVPENYIRKQTLAGGERFVTAELKETESLVLNAEAKINLLEYELFTKLREDIKAFVPELQSAARALARLDVLLSFAEVSEKNGYVKPLIDDGDVIRVEKGRHPVIEQSGAAANFVPNDAYLDRESASLLLITGPNMAGKSTYMRQLALIVLMAQIGCFVPCDKAQIGVCDRIFTRIGAADNLSQGQSTFFVEMSELAYILNSLSGKSLVLLDEIGRGTSTYDGLSIAFSLCEYLEKLRVRTLFATHYHELTSLEERLPALKNLNVDVLEEDGKIVFLHKIVPGSASKSYGIHVARLAGVPGGILKKAEDKLSELESRAGGAEAVAAVPSYEGEQLSLFETLPSPLSTRLRELDLMELRPSEAIEILEELKAIADKG